MIYWFIRFINNYRQYVILTLLLLFSLFLLTLNDSKEVSNLRKLSFIFYGILNQLKAPVDEFIFYKSENEALRKENAELLEQLLDLKKFEGEKKELYDLLEFKKVNSNKFITAKIILKTSDALANKFIVNKGEKDGVKLNSVVISPKGLIGFISYLSNDYSIIHTIANVNVRVSVISKRTGAIGILSWDGEKFKIYNVNKSSDVREGDVFETSLYSSQFPAGIPVAIVTYSSKDTELLFYDITCKPATDLDRVSYCIISDFENINQNLILNLDK